MRVRYSSEHRRPLNFNPHHSKGWEMFQKTDRGLDRVETHVPRVRNEQLQGALKILPICVQ